MASHNWIQFVIDWIGLPALALLAVVFLFRRWHREYPFFFCYVVGAELVGVARLLFARSLPGMYFQIYWASDTALAAFAFLATYELFFKRLFPGFYKTRVYRLLFPGMAILITVFVAIAALVGGHSTALPTATRVYEFLRATVLLFFVGLMMLMGRNWSKQEFGIAFGFGLDVSTSLFLIGIWSHTSNRSAILGRLAVLAYDIACLLWLYCFWAAPKSQAVLPAPPLSPDALLEAKKWETSLKDFMSQGKR
jgi:hypothetical protein